MTHSEEKRVPNDYFLRSGYIYFPAKPTTISTVLGSSVVTLYDKSKKIGGMNHFLYP
jgi:chemotaxis protein CheD